MTEMIPRSRTMTNSRWTRWSWTALLVAAVAWVTSASCSSTVSGGDADSDVDSDGDGDGDADQNRLEPVGETNRFLEYEETTELVVRYLDPQDEPIRGALMTYEITGSASGSRLDAVTATTNDQGQATMRLTAGSTATTFQVQVMPPAGNTVAFAVTVSDAEVGSIVVRMSYAGDQSFTAYRALRWTEQACDSLDPDDLPTADGAAESVSRLSDRPRFDAVPPGDSYTVAVVAEIDGRPEGFGCVYPVAVDPQRVTEVNVRIEDIERVVRIEGTYELESYLDFGDTLPPSVSLGIDIFDELTDDHDPDRSVTDDRATPDDMCGQDPGAFIVDYVMRQSCHWECRGGEDFDECSEINHPIGDICSIYEENFQSWEGCVQGLPDPLFGGCGLWEYAAVPAQDLINEQIEAFVPAFVTSLLNIIGDLSRSINNAHVFSLLELEEYAELGAPFTHTLTEMQVRLRDLDGEYHEYRFDLADAGFTSLTASETAEISGSDLTLPDHRFSLLYGQLIQYIYIHGLLPLLGFESTADMLASWLDCAAIATTVHDYAEDLLGGLTPGVGTFEDWCDTGLESAGRAIERYIGSVVDSEGTLTLSGTATADDIDEDGLAHALADGVWDGQWGEETETGAVTGTFTGVLR
jgi:hypothetical protein